MSDKPKVWVWSVDRAASLALGGVAHAFPKFDRFARAVCGAVHTEDRRPVRARDELCGACERFFEGGKP